MKFKNKHSIFLIQDLKPTSTSFFLSTCLGLKCFHKGTASEKKYPLRGLSVAQYNGFVVWCKFYQQSQITENKTFEKT